MDASAKILIGDGCQVQSLRSNLPQRLPNHIEWPLFGYTQGAKAISLRCLEFAPGTETRFTVPVCDDVWYVYEGSGEIRIGDVCETIEPACGIYLAPNSALQLRVPGPQPLVVASARCPDPEGPDPILQAPPLPVLQTEKNPIVRLQDRKRLPAGDRWYRLLVDKDVGCTQVTQFVGSIPPGKAAPHLHEYEEVICILQGEGNMWAGDEHTPVRRGTCIYLPRRQMHCLENTGKEALQLVGVFYPAGSPAVNYES